MKTNKTFALEYREGEEWLVWQTGFDSYEEAFDTFNSLPYEENLRIIEIEVVQRVVFQKEMAAETP